MLKTQSKQTVSKNASVLTFFGLSVIIGALAGISLIWVDYLLVIAFLVTSAIGLYLFLNPHISLVVLIISTPFNSTIDMLSGNNVLLSAWRDALFFLIIAGWLMALSRRKLYLVAHYIPLMIVIFTGWVAISATRTDNFSLGLLAFRGNVRFLPLVLVAMSLIHKDKSRINLFLHAIAVSGLVAATINLYVYFSETMFYGPINNPVRYLGSFPLERMLGVLSGPSNLGSYLAASLIIVVASLVVPNHASPFWMKVISLPITLCLFLTISYSAWLSFVTVISLLILFNRPKKRSNHWKYLLVALVVLPSIAILFLTTIDRGISVDRWNSHNSLTSYLVDGYLSKMAIQDLIYLSFSEFSIGTGVLPINLPEGVNVGDFVSSEGQKVGSHDNAWMRLALQLGFPVVGLVFLTLAILLVRSVYYGWISSRKRPLVITPFQVQASFLASLAMLLTLNLPRWMMVGGDVNFPVLLGILAYIDRIYTKSSSVVSSSVNKQSLSTFHG